LESNKRKRINNERFIFLVVLIEMGQQSEKNNGIVCEHSLTRAEQRPSQTKENVATALSSRPAPFLRPTTRGEFDYPAR